MLNKDYIEDMTMAYIHSYNVAMNEVKNPEFAAQIAVGIVLAIHTTEHQKRQETNPFEILFTHIAKQIQEERSEKKHDREENETD